MKKFLFVLLLTGFCMTVSGLRAQTGDSYRQELDTYLNLTGGLASFDAAIDQMLQLSLPKEQLEKVKNVLHEKAKEQLVDLLVPVYKNHVSLEDLREINAFYRTPAGKRIAAAQPELVRESIQVGQQWGMGLQSLIEEALK